MKTEYEIRILEIDVENFIEQIESLGAIKDEDYFQRRYVYDLISKTDNEWIRLRSDGKTTTLTYKCIESGKIDGTKEIEITVSDFAKTNELLEKMGYVSKGYQENKRTRYYLEEIEIDIDSWPGIPIYVEIEGPNEITINQFLDKIKYNKNNLTSLDVQNIYYKYGYKEEDLKELKFEEK